MWSSIQKKVSPSESLIDNEHEKDDNIDMESCDAIKIQKEEESEGKNIKTIGIDSNFDHSPHISDEVSISTKDSMGHRTIIESVCDLQAETTEAFESNDDEIIHDHFDDFKDYSGCNNEAETTSIDQGQNIFESSKSDEEVDVDQLSFEQEDSLSSNSFRRIEKRAALRSKVEVSRQNVSSKLSVLKSKSSELPTEAPIKVSTEEPSNKPAEDPTKETAHLSTEKKLNLANKKDCADRNDTVTMKEDVYLDLGNIMIKENLNSMDILSSNEANMTPSNEQDLADAPKEQNITQQTLLSKILTRKVILYLIVISSLVLNILHIFPTVQDGEDLTNQQKLVSNAMSLLLVHLKLNKVQDEVLKFHRPDTNSPYKSIVFLLNVVMLMITISIMFWSSKFKLTNGKVDIKEDNETMTSPKPRKFQRELSSLDKRNIFPSTVSAHMVQKDGSLVEVKRTMRFSPELKRFSPAPVFKKSKNSKHSAQAHIINTQKKRIGIFSPPLKMRNILKTKKET